MLEARLDVKFNQEVLAGVRFIVLRVRLNDTEFTDQIN